MKRNPRPESAAPREPGVRELERDECTAMLARHSVGRLAYSLHDRVSIQPINYLLDGEWLYGRTSAGGKLKVIATNRWVAFEVDEVDGHASWRSVVVHGAMYVLSPDGAPREVEAYERGIELTRARNPAAWTEEDPVGHRSVMFRIHMAEVSGRESSG